MSENLKVNANSSVLEHKRKHNLLVDKANEIPNVSVSDNGKVLGVNAQGKYELKDPSSVNAVDIENIYDSDGHKRFIEGNLQLETIEGVTFGYNKWSLSGTHLMIVLAGTIDANTEIVNAQTFARIVIPQWILDKIYPVFSGNIESKDLDFWNDEYEHQVGGIYLNKETSGLRLFIGAINITTAKAFRTSFDLLIDNE